MARKASSSRKPGAKQAALPSLIVTISGIRGITGEAFTPEAVLPYLSAFSRMCGKGKVVLGHDARASSRWILPFVESVLRYHGLDVLFAGLIATPTTGLLVRRLRASGGICVTASHNPMEYNGLKFFHRAGEFITAEMLAELKRLAAEPELPGRKRRVGSRTVLEDPASHHLTTVLKAFPPRRKPAKRPLVVIDCCNSTGAVLAPRVAEAYGARVETIFDDTEKLAFPRVAEPLAKNLGALRRAVKKSGAAAGFAIDPDGDRLALIDEKGRALGEERTLVLAADAYYTLHRGRPPLVVNLSSTRANEDVAAKHGAKVFRTAIGEANVLAGIKAHRAKIGGEGNGGVIVPAVQPGRDAAAAIALILLGLRERGGTLSEWNASIPDYEMRKTAVPLDGLSVADVLTNMRKAFHGATFDRTDGLKVILPESWVHVRASNTEPIVRIMAEAPTATGVDELIRVARAQIE